VKIVKILIADDERMVRVALRDMLEDLNLNIEDICEVDNGEKLLKALNHYTPDIAFVDIKMPKLTGLQAIKEAKLLSPYTQWVILTGFSEFEYAKEAIELGVSKYLLKPVSPEELDETVTALNKNSFQNLRTLNKKFERDIIALYNKFDSAKGLQLESITMKASFNAALFYFDGSDRIQGISELKKSFFSELLSAIDRLLTNEIRIALFNVSETSAATVCAFELSKSHSSINSINEYFRRMDELIEKYRNRGLSITAIRSENFSSYKEMNYQLSEINRLNPLRIIYGTGKMHKAAELRAQTTEPFYNSLGSSILDLCKYYNDANNLYYNNTLRKLEKQLSASKLKLDENMKNSISNFLEYSINFSLKLENNIPNWINALRVHGEKQFEAMNTDSSSYVNQVIDFIAENYMYDIGINTIAQALNITPNYLSSLFHKKTNMKFTDYLTELRILKAKELLANNKLSIADISKMVGYHSTRHFTKLFLKYTKLYPSDYRKNLNQKSEKYL